MAPGIVASEPDALGEKGETIEPFVVVVVVPCVERKPSCQSVHKL